MALKNQVKIEVKNFKKVSRRLRKKGAQMSNGSLKGLIEGVALIRRDMDKTPPLIPVDQNILRPSWTVQINKGKRSLKFGFTTSYAAAVHFKLDGGVNWSRPNSGPLFFSSAIARNYVKVLKVIAENSKV